MKNTLLRLDYYYKRLILQTILRSEKKSQKKSIKSFGSHCHRIWQSWMAWRHYTITISLYHFFLSSLLRLNSIATPTSAWCRSWVNGCCSFNWTKQKSRSWLAPHDPTGYADWVTFCDNASPLYIQCCAQFFHLVIIGVKHLFYLGWITTSWGNMLC